MRGELVAVTREMLAYATVPRHQLRNQPQPAKALDPGGGAGSTDRRAEASQSRFGSTAPALLHGDSQCSRGLRLDIWPFSISRATASNHQTRRPTAVLGRRALSVRSAARRRGRFPDGLSNRSIGSTPSARESTSYGRRIFTSGWISRRGTLSPCTRSSPATRRSAIPALATSTWTSAVSTIGTSIPRLSRWTACRRVQDCDRPRPRRVFTTWRCRRGPPRTISTP